MTCAITRPDPQILHNFVTSTFSSDVLGGAPIAPETTEWFVVNSQYLSSEWFFSIAEQAMRETRPEEMCADNLVAYFARYGIYPKAKQFARGYVLLTGTVGTIIPPELSVTFTGKDYVPDPLSTPPTVIGTDGKAIVMMQAVIPGSVGNSTGLSGFLTSSVAGINDAVTAYGSQFCAGSEAEEIEAFRARGLLRLASPPTDDWVWLNEVAQEWPCVTRLCRRFSPCCNTGRIEAYAFFDQSFENGLAPQGILNDVNRWLFGSTPGVGDGRARIGLFGKLFTATPLSINVTVKGLDGITVAQWNEIVTQFRGLFANRCPGETVCHKWFEAIVTGVSMRDCSFSITLSAQSTPHLTCDGDINPTIDHLPILGTIVGGPIQACTFV